MTMLIAKVVTTAAFVVASFLPKNNLPEKHELTNSERQTMLEAVNRLRSQGCQCGRKYMPPVGPVVWNPLLEKAAQAHATDMLRNDFFAHVSSNGSSIGDRANRAGYEWYAVGENIAEGYESFNATLLAWKASPGHCVNLMRGGYKEMGVALVDDIWVQDFGAPMNN